MKERIYAFLRNRSIYLRIYRTNLAVAILPLILLAVLFIVIYTSASMYWFGDTEEETLSHYAQSIASELYHFDNAIVGVAQDERTQDLLSRYLTMGDYERYEAQDQLTEMVLGELHMLDYVTDVALVTNNSAVIQIYNGPHDDFEIDAFDYATFVKKAFSAKTNTVLGDAASYARPDANPGNRNGFLYAKRVTDLKNNSVNIGYILAYLDKSAFFGQDIGASSGADDGTHRYIVDPGVRVVYASSNLSDSDARRLLSVLPDHIRAGLSSFFTRVSDGSPLPSLCTAYPVSEFGWYVVTVVPLWAFMSNVVTIVGLTLLLIALIAVLQWLLSSGISGSIDVPIRQIIQALHRIENGDFTEMTEDGFKDELSGVIHSLNYTCRLLDKLFKEAREHEFNKYELQLQAMQAQMNPHFVMNTLNSVILLADLQGADNIKAFCKALSRLMQNMLKGDTLYHTVREEISLLKDYALIMQYRYFDRFSVP